MTSIFKLLDNIEKAASLKKEVVVIDKMGKFHRGEVYDHYVRLSSDKLRGKIKLRLSSDHSEIEVDANDILEIELN